MLRSFLPVLSVVTCAIACSGKPQQAETTFSPSALSAEEKGKLEHFLKGIASLSHSLSDLSNVGAILSELLAENIGWKHRCLHDMVAHADLAAKPKAFVACGFACERAEEDILRRPREEWVTRIVEQCGLEHFGLSSEQRMHASLEWLVVRRAGHILENYYTRAAEKTRKRVDRALAQFFVPLPISRNATLIPPEVPADATVPVRPRIYVTVDESGSMAAGHVSVAHIKPGGARLALQRGKAFPGGAAAPRELEARLAELRRRDSASKAPADDGNDSSVGSKMVLDDHGGTGTKMALDEGKMGRKMGRRGSGHFVMRPEPGVDPERARQNALDAARRAGLTGVLEAAQDTPFTRLTGSIDMSSDARLLGATKQIASAGTVRFPNDWSSDPRRQRTLLLSHPTAPATAVIDAATAAGPVLLGVVSPGRSEVAALSYDFGPPASIGYGIPKLVISLNDKSSWVSQWKGTNYVHKKLSANAAPSLLVRPIATRIEQSRVVVLVSGKVDAQRLMSVLAALIEAGAASPVLADAGPPPTWPALRIGPREKPVGR